MILRRGAHTFFSAFPKHPGLVSLTICLAEINPDQIVLENVVVEHVFGGFAQIDESIRLSRRFYPVGHILRHTLNRSHDCRRRSRKFG